ncbi:MAG: YhbY family RNA-binding protein [Clostridiales bacterium]|nr:YhbY family RNA-binding protein [Clostridiales bacterium]
MIITSENITSKQRSKLKSIASKLSPVTQIGKSGITDNLLKTLSDALDAHEIIKVNILETADDDIKNLAENVAELLEAVPVAVIGRKAIFYRYSRRDKFVHLDI